MKNFLGLALFGLIAAGVGAAATIFALKKRDEFEAYEEYDDDEFCDDCDCNCEECAACEDYDDATDDVEKDLDSVESDTSDLEKEDGADKSDF